MAALGHTVDSGSGASGDYASLNALESAQQQDLTDNGGDTYTATCITTGDFAADTTSVSFDGWVTAAANYITATAGPGHSAVASGWKATQYRLVVTDVDCLQIYDDHVRVDGLQIQFIYSSGAGKGLISINNIAAGSDIRISNCRLLGDTDGDANTYGIITWDADANVIVWNTIVYDIDFIGYYVVAGTVDYYNCLAYGASSFGFYNDGGTTSAINCVSFKTGDDFFALTVISYCSSDDDDTTDATNVDGNEIDADWTTDFTGAATGDFTLVSGTPLIGAADVDPSGSGYGDPDIDGTTRGAAWDVGPHEFVAAVVGGLSLPVAMAYYNRIRRTSGD